jgi:putative exosortase-associated protein (TIGR04073 family)
MKPLLPLLALTVSLTIAQADLTMPKSENFYDKAGRGLANIAMAPAEILDSHYSVLEEEGPTAGFFKGMVVQGPSRMIMDIGMGIYEVITSPFPPYQSLKLKSYDAGVVNEYPPSDLTNWY